MMHRLRDIKGSKPLLSRRISTLVLHHVACVGSCMSPYIYLYLADCKLRVDNSSIREFCPLDFPIYMYGGDGKHSLRTMEEVWRDAETANIPNQNQSAGHTNISLCGGSFFPCRSAQPIYHPLPRFLFIYSTEIETPVRNNQKNEDSRKQKSTKSNRCH